MSYRWPRNAGELFFGCGLVSLVKGQRYGVLAPRSRSFFFLVGTLFIFSENFWYWYVPNEECIKNQSAVWNKSLSISASFLPNWEVVTVQFSVRIGKNKKNASKSHSVGWKYEFSSLRAPDTCSQTLHTAHHFPAFQLDNPSSKEIWKSVISWYKKVVIELSGRDPQE